MPACLRAVCVNNHVAFPLISPQSTITTEALVVPLLDPKPSMVRTCSMPEVTCPNTTCFPSSLRVATTGVGWSSSDDDMPDDGSINTHTHTERERKVVHNSP